MGGANTQRMVGQRQREGRRREKKEIPLNTPPKGTGETGAESEQLLPASLAPDLTAEFSWPLTEPGWALCPTGQMLVAGAPQVWIPGSAKHLPWGSVEGWYH